MPQGAKATSELLMGASFDRLRFRLPDPEPSPVGLANAGFPLGRGRRFFLGLGEEGGGPIYSSGSRLDAGPQRGAASPKPRIPIEEGFLTSLAKIQARTSAFEVRGSRVAQTCRSVAWVRSRRTKLGAAGASVEGKCGRWCRGSVRSRDRSSRCGAGRCDKPWRGRCRYRRAWW